jgi:pimeloyl-ACP methyl ester carboxylesterase
MSESRFLNVDGVRLEAQWHGPSPDLAPTLVFLHEGLGCAQGWRAFPGELAEATGCGALVYSRAGYGASDPCELPRPLSYMEDDGLTVLPRVLSEAGIRECILVGHSDGGSIALVYAGGTAASPLRGVITEGAHVFCEAISVSSIGAAREAYETGDLKRRLTARHGANTECAFRGWNDAWLHPGFRRWNIERYLTGVRVPVLAIQGADDEYGTSAQVDAIVRGTGGNARALLLPRCGHSPHRELPERCLEEMAGFVEAVLRDRSRRRRSRHR